MPGPAGQARRGPDDPRVDHAPRVRSVRRPGGRRGRRHRRAARSAGATTSTDRDRPTATNLGIRRDLRPLARRDWAHARCRHPDPRSWRVRPCAGSGPGAAPARRGATDRAADPPRRPRRPRRPVRRHRRRARRAARPSSSSCTCGRWSAGGCRCAASSASPSSARTASASPTGPPSTCRARARATPACWRRSVLPPRRAARRPTAPTPAGTHLVVRLVRGPPAPCRSLVTGLGQPD